MFKSLNKYFRKEARFPINMLQFNILKKKTYVLQESRVKLLKNQSTLQIVRHLFSISEYLFIGKFVLKNNQPSFLLKIEGKGKRSFWQVKKKYRQRNKSWLYVI